MKKESFKKCLFLFFLVVLLISLIAINCLEPTLDLPTSTNSKGHWRVLGSDYATPGAASYVSLFVNKGIPYVAYRDDTEYYTYSNKACVKKFNGTNWEYIGNSGFSNVSPTTISLYVYEGIPYIAYKDAGNSYKASVMRYNGTNWEYIGNPGFTVGAVSSISLYVYNGISYISYQDQNYSYKVSVMRYNGSNWEYIGNPGFTNSSIAFISLQVYNGIPYVTTNGRVMKYNGSTWEYVGNMYTESYNLPFYLYNGIPYITANDRVMKYNSIDWEYIDFSSFANSNSEYISSVQLFIDAEISYVAYRKGYPSSPVVKKLEGNSWISLGERDLSPIWEYAKDLSLFVNEGVPYLAYTCWVINDNEYVYQITGQLAVMKYVE